MKCPVELYHSFIQLPCWLKHTLIWVTHHQTLLAGIIAGFAAFLTLKKMREQIFQQEMFRNDDRAFEKRKNLFLTFIEVVEVQNNLWSLYKNLTKQLPHERPQLLIEHISPIGPHNIPVSQLPYEILFDANDPSDEILSDLIFFFKKYNTRILAYNHLNEDNAQLKNSFLARGNQTFSIDLTIFNQDSIKLLQLENSMRSFFHYLVEDMEFANALIFRLNKISKKRHPDITGYYNYEKLEFIEFLKDMPQIDINAFFNEKI